MVSQRVSCSSDGGKSGRWFNIRNGKTVMRRLVPCHFALKVTETARVIKGHETYKGLALRLQIMMACRAEGWLLKRL